jgi:hypothetical protein
MTQAFEDIHLPGEDFPRRGRLLAEVAAEGSLPRLQIYDSFEYLLAIKRHCDGRIEHRQVWISDDAFDGKCQPVHPLPEAEIRDDLRDFFGDDARTEALLAKLPPR